MIILIINNDYRAEQSLINIIETCQIGDAVYFIASLRKAVNRLDYAGCLGPVPLHDTGTLLLYF